MRGGLSPEMTTTCVQSAMRPLGAYQANMIMGPSSPASAWQFQSVIPVRILFIIFTFKIDFALSVILTVLIIYYWS